MSKAESITKQERPIILKGIRVNNLKNIDVEIPRNRLTVVTGVSGSGKSSLAFDTIYAEGQRRYVESLSSYARQFLERMDKPDVDFMQGISPAMAIQQKNATTNPRSTVGTSTEIYDYLRLLYARVGKTISPISGLEVKKDSPSSVVQDLLQRAASGSRFYVLFPLPNHDGQALEDECRLLLEKGFFRMLGPNEEVLDLSPEFIPKNLNRTDWSVLVDRLSIADTEEFKTRLSDSV
jgi:excinuclease ABC subunit A